MQILIQKYKINLNNLHIDKNSFHTVNFQFNTCSFPKDCVTFFKRKKTRGMKKIKKGLFGDIKKRCGNCFDFVDE